MHGFISWLSILFHWSIFLFLCQYILSWCLQLCSIIWSQEGWFLQLQSSFLRLLWLLGVFFCFYVNCETFCSSFFFFFSWRLITLRYHSGSCHTLTWISHGVTCVVPHPDPPSHLPLYPLPLGLPNAPGPSTCLMHPTWQYHFWAYTPRKPDLKETCAPQCSSQHCL